MHEQQDGGERRRLERAPSERYRRETPGGSVTRTGMAPRSRAIIATALVSDAGAVGFFLLGLLDLGVGLAVVAAFVGWVTGVTLIWWGRDTVATGRARSAVAALFAGGAIVVGMAVDWAYALVQGGVLGPVDYVAQRYEAWGPVSIAAAVLLAMARAR